MIGAIRHALLWVRLLTGVMADGHVGGALVLVLPPAATTADVVAVHGILGVARSASVSLAADGVRTHVVERADGDEATFGSLVAALAAEEQRWLSGHVLATSVHDIAALSDDEPLWQLFVDPALGGGRQQRIDVFLRSTNAPAWAPRTERSVV
jgi:hypothetical protein